MITRLLSLHNLPYKSYHTYLLKTEQDTQFIGESNAYVFISQSPKCIYLFVDDITDKE